VKHDLRRLEARPRLQDVGCTGVTKRPTATTLYLHYVSPQTRPQLPNGAWDSVTPEARRTLNAGIDEAEHAEFADMTPYETEHYLRTGELPERVERWLGSYDSRPRT